MQQKGEKRQKARQKTDLRNSKDNHYPPFVLMNFHKKKMTLRLFVFI